ncbi:hypothetical protein GALMADRAFT_149027 [Galerina marginata CBS 339.88]|uniref:Uncharacterized protein n=1 Tax=Galerina marginata (strain CBS 339.88) TaxID=685588 RepID=A0A067S2M2_GALM3|nr:hypothetical protein GALMADRAFT_149027 [Galerina marginata CBS 339.88]
MKSTAESTEFPPVQKTFLKSFYPEYEKYIAEHNPEHNPYSAALTEWRKKKAKVLMEDDCIQDLVKSSPVGAKKWEEAIRRFYCNHYNNKFLADSRRAAAQSATPSLTAALSSSSSDTASPIPSTNKAVQDVLRCAIVTFLGDLSAREMFASENEDAIRKKMDDIRAESPSSTLVGGGLRNKALKILWENADQDLWKAKIDTLARDIQANREEFPALMLQALQNLCNRDRLGSTLMSFSYAFRDAKSDWIKGGMLFAGYDDHKKKPVTVKPSDHKAQLDAWLAHADAVLSRKPKVSVYKIPLNEDGIPIPPHIEVLEASVVQIATLLDEYLVALWEFSQSNGPVSTIPWELIARSPNDYFDASIYQLPCALKSPEQLKSEPLSILALYQYFSTTSTSTPFQFRSRPAISSDNLTADSDDDDDEVDVLLNHRPSKSLPPKTTNDAATTPRPRPQSISVDATPIPNASTISPSKSPLLANRDTSPPGNAPADFPSVMGSSVQALPSTATEPPPTQSPEEASPFTVSSASGINAGRSSADALAKSSTKKKNKGRGQSKRETATNKEDNRAKDDNRIGSADRVPRRASTRTADLKRKKMDTEAVDTQPAKKRTTLKERWAWVPVGSTL